MTLWRDPKQVLLEIRGVVVVVVVAVAVAVAVAVVVVVGSGGVAHTGAW